MLMRYGPKLIAPAGRRVEQMSWSLGAAIGPCPRPHHSSTRALPQAPPHRHFGVDGHIPSPPLVAAQQAAAAHGEPPLEHGETSQRQRVRIGKMYPNSRRRLMKRFSLSTDHATPSFVAAEAPLSVANEVGSTEKRRYEGEASLSMASVGDDLVHGHVDAADAAARGVCAGMGDGPLKDRSRRGYGCDPAKLAVRCGGGLYVPGQLEIVGCHCSMVRGHSHRLVVHSF